LVSAGGKVLFDQSVKLDRAYPALYGTQTWPSPRGRATVVFGLGTRRVFGLYVITPRQQNLTTVTERVHPKGLPADMRFFVRSLGKVEVISVTAVDRHGNDLMPH
jgi:hypothetical protein